MSQYVQGDKELIGKLQALKKTEAGAAIRKGSRAGSKIVAASIKASVPVRTGALKASIKVRALPRRKNSTGTRVIETVPYVGFVEFGTHHAPDGRHFMEKATSQVAVASLDVFLRTMKTEIEQRMKK